MDLTTRVEKTQVSFIKFYAHIFTISQRVHETFLEIYQFIFKFKLNYSSDYEI